MVSRFGKRNRKHPPAHSVSNNAASIILGAARGKRKSACRNQKTSPRATLAPAFICNPRPVGAERTRSAYAVAIITVASWLPPSTTIISAFGAIDRTWQRNSAMSDSSSRTGTMTERYGGDATNTWLHRNRSRNPYWFEHFMATNPNDENGNLPTSEAHCRLLVLSGSNRHQHNCPRSRFKSSQSRLRAADQLPQESEIVSPI